MRKFSPRRNFRVSAELDQIGRLRLLKDWPFSRFFWSNVNYCLAEPNRQSSTEANSHILLNTINCSKMFHCITSQYYYAPASGRVALSDAVIHLSVCLSIPYLQFNTRLPGRLTASYIEYQYRMRPWCANACDFPVTAGKSYRPSNNHWWGGISYHYHLGNTLFKMHFSVSQSWKRYSGRAGINYFRQPTKISFLHISRVGRVMIGFWVLLWVRRQYIRG